MLTVQRTKKLRRLNSLLFCVILSACSEPTEQAQSQANDQSANYYHSAHIETISPSSSYDIDRNYIGKVVSKQLASVSFEYAGKVTKVYVDSGDIIKQGQLLAELNTELLAIKQQEIAATIAQLNAQAELNRLNLSRIYDLNIKGYSSRQALDELETEKKVITADLSRQQANIANIKYQMSRAKLHAPFGAIISTRAIAEGENFSPNQTAFELIKQSHHEVSVGVPVSVASRLKVGQTLSVTLDKQVLPATILVIGKQVNNISRTVELRLELSQKSPFYNGQMAQVNIKQKIPQAGFWLPLSALTDGVRGQWNVFQVTPKVNDLYTISATTVAVKYSTLDAAYITGLPLVPVDIIVAGVHRYVPKQIVKRAEQVAMKEQAL